MSRRQKAESAAMRAKLVRLRAELTRHDCNVHTPSGATAINVTEEEIPPTASLVQRVDPDTVRTETGPPTDTNITEGEIPPTASLSQRVDPDTDQTETGPHDKVNSMELMTQGVAHKDTTPTKGTTSTTERASLQQT